MTVKELKERLEIYPDDYKVTNNTAKEFEYIISNYDNKALALLSFEDVDYWN